MTRTLHRAVNASWTAGGRGELEKILNLLAEAYQVNPLDHPHTALWLCDPFLTQTKAACENANKVRERQARFLPELFLSYALSCHV